MSFSSRIKRSFGIFGRDDPNAKYGVYEILNNTSKLVSSGNRDTCEKNKDKLVNDLAKKTPRYVVRKLSNLWSFSTNVEEEMMIQQVFDSLKWLIDNSKNKKLINGCNRLYDEFDKLCKINGITNFNDLSEVKAKWEPPEGLFAEGSAKEIADEVHKSHDSLKSAISCINFYLNRGGDNITDDRRKVIEEAKDLVRDMYE